MTSIDLKIEAEMRYMRHLYALRAEHPEHAEEIDRDLAALRQRCEALVTERDACSG